MVSGASEVNVTGCEARGIRGGGYHMNIPPEEKTEAARQAARDFLRAIADDYRRHVERDNELAERYNIHMSDERGE